MNDTPEIIELPQDTDINPEAQPQFVDETATVIGAAPYAPKQRSILMWGIALFLTTAGFFLSVSVWGFISTLLAQNPILGLIATVLCAAMALWFCIFTLREGFALMRLRRLDHLQQQAKAVRKTGDFTAAKTVLDGLSSLYSKRPDTQWAYERLQNASRMCLMQMDC